MLIKDLPTSGFYESASYPDTSIIYVSRVSLRIKSGCIWHPLCDVKSVNYIIFDIDPLKNVDIISETRCDNYDWFDIGRNISDQTAEAFITSNGLASLLVDATVDISAKIISVKQMANFNLANLIPLNMTAGLPNGSTSTSTSIAVAAGVPMTAGNVPPMVSVPISGMSTKVIKQALPANTNSQTCVQCKGSNKPINTGFHTIYYCPNCEP